MSGFKAAVPWCAGKGRWTYADGAYYEGELGNGRRVRGRFVSSNCATEYEGNWRNDLHHGAGMMVQRNAWKYTGADPTCIGGIGED